MNDNDKILMEQLILNDLLSKGVIDDEIFTMALHKIATESEDSSCN